MAFRSAATTNTSGADLTANAPAGVVAGDRLVAIFSQDIAGATFTVPGGWSTPTQADCSGPDSQSIAFSERIATGTDSYAFSSSSSSGGVVHVLAFSGRHASTASTFGTPSVNISSNASPLSVAVNGVTATSGDDLLWCAGLDITSSGATATITALTGFTQRSSTTNGLGCAISATQDNVSAGATGTLTGTVTLSAGNSGWGAIVIAIPADVPTGPTINTHPQNATVYQGQTANFTVSATTSGGTLHYQWKDDGSNVGTDSNSYTTASTVLGDNGAQITCVVSDDNGPTTSNAATLTVIPTGITAWLRG